MEHTGQFDPDHSASHTDDTFRQLGKVPARIAIDHIAPVNPGKRGYERHRTGGKNDLVRTKLLWRPVTLGTLTLGHRDGTRGIDGSQPIKHINMVTLHQCPDTAGHALDDAGGKGDGFAHVKLRWLREFDAQFAHRGHTLHNFGDVQHRLGGNAPDVEAGATQILLFDDGSPGAQLRSANGSHIAPRARANYRDIIVRTCHALSPLRSQQSERPWRLLTQQTVRVLQQPLDLLEEA